MGRAKRVPAEADGGEGAPRRRFAPGRATARGGGGRPSGDADLGQIMAVLGPTNTGKTHFAVERMLAHPSGVIGLPLRLLAREVFDRVLAAKGAHRVRLQTGEEVIGPKDAPWVVATVEAMPIARRFSFLAVDEIQLAADFERGHVFTDRLLHARGDDETIFLGSDVARALVRKLVPQAEIVSRPRFSTLSWAGSTRINRLPRRSALVAFTASDVYRLAEIVRRQKGGAAVVMGALSPRTRNAQVAMYQAGEVEYLVATDAIGMGLNMDLDHVAFAALSKFDGRTRRRLTPPEIAQIAGRAGRHVADGTFGVTAGAGELDEAAIGAVESHQFDPLRRLRWRNADLDFSSLDALEASLAVDPPDPALVKVRDGIDDRALGLLAKDEEIRSLALGAEGVRRLWRVCQIPDFRKTLSDGHLRFLRTVFEHLSGPRGRLPADWVAARIDALERTDGDIEALTQRLAHVRTWTYVSHREDWLDDPLHWRGRARAVEDALSDALHERLTQRFVDKRTATLLRSMREKETLLGAVDKQGSIVVEGHALGRIDGLTYTIDGAESAAERKIVAAAARRAVGPALAERARAFAAASDAQIELSGAELLWGGAPVARVLRGDDPLRPEVELIAAEALTGGARRSAQRRAKARLERWLEQRLGALGKLRAASRSAELAGPARGLAWALVEGWGMAPVDGPAGRLGDLDEGARKALAGLGVRLGARWAYVAPLLRADAIEARRRLRGLWLGREIAIDPAAAVARGVDASEEDLAALGFVRAGSIAVRVDLVERAAAKLRAAARKASTFGLPAEAADAAGLTTVEALALAERLGFRRAGENGEAGPPRLRRPARRRPPAAASAPEPRGAFAALALWTPNAARPDARDGGAAEEGASPARAALRTGEGGDGPSPGEREKAERRRRDARRRRSKASKRRNAVAAPAPLSTASPPEKRVARRPTPETPRAEESARAAAPEVADAPTPRALDRERSARQERPASDCEALRLDKWLWRARFFKSRQLAAEFVAKRRPRINQLPTEKPHALLRIGDVLTLALRDRVEVLEIASLGARRGPAAEARLLYRAIE